jgi:lysophospholipase L1-like esterase
VSRSLELVAGLVLALVGLVLAAGAMEVGVRLLHLEPDRFWQQDPLLGTRLAPGRSGWWTQEDREFVVPVTINSHGWRDVERPLDKPAGTTRVLVLGDSFAEALQVPLEDSFPRRLEAGLNQALEAPVEVVNTGTSGFGTAGQLLLLRRDGVRHQPDVVLLAFYPGNDVMNNSSELDVTLVPRYDTEGRLERVVANKPAREPPGLVGRLLASSQAYLYLRRRIVTGHPDLARRLGLGRPAATAPAPGPDFVPATYGVYTPPEGDWALAWERTETLIRAIREETRAMGARMAVAVVAGRDEVYPEWWAEVLETYPAMKDRDLDLDRPRRRIVEICRRLGIPVLELAPVMRERRDGPPLHFHRDGHWTAAGHHLAAAEMANFLVKEGLFTKDTEGQPYELH